MTVLRGVGRFVYDFVIGDDWKIAAGVVGALRDLSCSCHDAGRCRRPYTSVHG